MATCDDESARRYLLGDLPEDEAAALEEECFAGQEAFERVRGVEDDLFDDYVAGALGTGERQRFEARLLRSPGQRQRLAAARALRLAGSDRSRAAARGSVRWRSAARLVGTLAALALLGLGLQRLRPNAPGPPAGPPPAPPRGATVPPAPAMPTAVATPGPLAASAATPFAIVLTPVLTRSGGGPGGIQIPAYTTQVRLELRGEAGQAVGARPWASVATVEGQAVFAGPAELPAAGDRPGLIATLRVPAAVLVPNDYVVALSSSARGEPTARYFLQVAP